VLLPWLRRGVDPSQPVGAGPWFGGALLALHWVCFFAAVRAGGVALALLGYGIYPVAAWLLEAGRRRPSRRESAAVALAALGIALLALSRPHPAASSPDPQAGLLLGLAAGLSFALLARLNGSLVRRLPPLALTARECGVAALLLLPLGGRDLLAASPGDWVGLLLLGTFCTALAHGLFIRGLGRAGHLSASVIVSLEPALGLLLAGLLLGELPSLGQTLAALPLLAGALLLAHRRARPLPAGC
jgi:drug/metabolite transporter (DMT)-like permease